MTPFARLHTKGIAIGKPLTCWTPRVSVELIPFCPLVIMTGDSDLSCNPCSGAMCITTLSAAKGGNNACTPCNPCSPAIRITSAWRFPRFKREKATTISNPLGMFPNGRLSKQTLLIPRLAKHSFEIRACSSSSLLIPRLATHRRFKREWVIPALD